METLASRLYTYKYHLLFAAIFLVYFFNLLIDVMEIDAAQYAVISMEMSWTKSFLHLYEHGKDYLDKPPLLFWLSSLSFIFFGLSNWAYKLPSLLIAILGIYSTFRFARLWYSKEKAMLSAFILASSQALFLITNDVRTDTILLGMVIFSTWQLSEYILKKKWKHLIFSAIGIGGAMMAKGPIALVVTIAAFGTDFLLKRQWKNIFKPQWIILLILIAIILLPMSYGLYTQFDLHPEKEVSGLKGPSGLRFYYWTQSFGRITGESNWNNGAGFFFFFHSILWDFQPWILLFMPALFFKIKNVVLNKFKGEEDQEYVTLGGFVLMFLALSLSKFKLPHYIFVLFPFASILTADFIYQLNEKLQSRISKIQFGIMHLLWLAMIINFIFFFPPENFILPIILLIIFIIKWLSFNKLKGKAEKIFVPTILTAVALNLLMAINFYPNLLKYQAGSQAGKLVMEKQVSKDMLYHYKKKSHSLCFYSQRIVTEVNLGKIDSLKKGCWIYTDEKGYNELIENRTAMDTVKIFPSFHVTALEFPFLLQKTREQTLKKEYLLEIQ